MKKLLAALLLMTPVAAQAHEVWIERDGDGPARIYLGEPGEALPAGGDPEFANLKAPKLIGAPATPQVRKAGYIEVAAPPGDVRAWDDNVFAPWGPEGKKEGVTYSARAGRAEAMPAMPFEIAPRTPVGDAFIVTRRGRPVADLEVKLIGPDKSSRTLRTNAAGMINTAPLSAGRHLLVAAAKDTGQIASGASLAVHHQITTTSFVVQ